MAKSGDIVTDSTPMFLDVHPLEIWRDEEEVPNQEGDTFTFVCCDCALVHHVGVWRDKNTGEITIGMSRDNRSTAQYRRHENGALHRGVGKWRLVRNEK